MKAEYDFSKGKRGPVVPGKTRISIFIDNDVIAAFKSKAETAGVGYQTMMNEALRNHLTQVEQPLTAQVLRNVLRQEMPKYVSTGRNPKKRGEKRG
jgi:hypothetical protein